MLFRGVKTTVVYADTAWNVLALLIASKNDNLEEGKKGQKYQEIGNKHSVISNLEIAFEGTRRAGGAERGRSCSRKA